VSENKPMQLIVRIIVGAAGLLSLLLAARFFQDPTAAATLLGIAPAGVLGTATLRGDFGAFFGVCGILALAAAIRNSAALLTAPLLVIAIALTGRIVSYALEGGGPAVMQPMLVELTLLVVFGLGRLTLARA
jgi:hypothetical protein